jgi:phospholipid/cholesterol/gamma-HCH transport system substrate-binding protein
MMNERQMQFRVGVVVFATMIIGGLLATLNGPMPSSWLPWGRLTYDVGIELQQAPGVGPNTPVRKNGILIGRVKSIEDKDVGVVLKAEIDGDRPLFPQYQPHVRTSVLGDATIDFETLPVPPGAQAVPDGTVFKGVVDPSPFDSLANLSELKDDFGEAARSLGRAGDAVTRLANQVTDTFGDDQETGRIKRVLDTTERAMDQFATTMASINEIIGDEPIAAQRPVNGQLPPNDQFTPGGQAPPAGQTPTGQPPSEGQEMRQRLRQTLYDLPDAISEARTTMKELRTTLDSAKKNLDNLQPFTEGLGETGDEIAARILETTEGLNQLVVNLNDVTDSLNNREGTIGQLIHERTTYDNLNTLMCNANKVLYRIDELARSLRPVVDNVRIATDKVAREPGRVVTGGLNPSPIK